MARVPVEDRDGWARLTSDAAGVLAAAAAATPNVVLQRELTRAWQAVNRCVRSSEPAAAAETVVSESATPEVASEQVNASESAPLWAEPARFDRAMSSPNAKLRRCWRERHGCCWPHGWRTHRAMRGSQR